MKTSREEIINRLWETIHGRYKSVFYWMDGTKTRYRYDVKTDAIISDNGFSVSVDMPTDSLTRDYICSLIEQLEGEIAEYYLEFYNIELI